MPGVGHPAVGLTGARVRRVPQGVATLPSIRWMRSQRRSVLSRKLRSSWHKRLARARWSIIEW